MRTHTDLKTVLMLVVIKSAPCSWRTDALWHSVRRWIIYDVSHHRQTGCNGQTIAGALSLPSRALSSRYLCPSVTHVHSLSICYTHTHTHTRLGRLLSKRNCLQITECFLITVVIPTQCWVSLWLLYRCIWMTLEYRRLNGVSFHFNSAIIVILQERSSIFHLLKDGFINFFFLIISNVEPYALSFPLLLLLPLWSQSVSFLLSFLPLVSSLLNHSTLLSPQSVIWPLLSFSANIMDCLYTLVSVSFSFFCLSLTFKCLFSTSYIFPSLLSLLLRPL